MTGVKDKGLFFLENQNVVLKLFLLSLEKVRSVARNGHLKDRGQW